MLTNQAGVLLKCGNAVIVQLRIRVRGLLVAHPRKAKQTARPSRLLKTPRCLSRPAVSAAFLRWRARIGNQFAGQEAKAAATSTFQSCWRSVCSSDSLVPEPGAHPETEHLWTAVRVEKEDAVRQILFRCTEHNVSEGCDSDTARQKRRRSLHIVIESQAAGRFFDLNCAA